MEPSFGGHHLCLWKEEKQYKQRHGDGASLPPVNSPDFRGKGGGRQSSDR